MHFQIAKHISPFNTSAMLLTEKLIDDIDKKVSKRDQRVWKHVW